MNVYRRPCCAVYLSPEDTDLWRFRRRPDPSLTILHTGRSLAAHCPCLQHSPAYRYSIVLCISKFRIHFNIYVIVLITSEISPLHNSHTFSSSQPGPNPLLSCSNLQTGPTRVTLAGGRVACVSAHHQIGRILKVFLKFWLPTWFSKFFQYHWLSDQNCPLVLFQSCS